MQPQFLNYLSSMYIPNLTFLLPFSQVRTVQHHRSPP